MTMYLYEGALRADLEGHILDMMRKYPYPIEMSRTPDYPWDRLQPAEAFLLEGG